MQFILSSLAILLTVSLVRSEANYIEFGSQEHKDIVHKNFGHRKENKAVNIPKVNNLANLAGEHYVDEEITDLGEALECVYTDECVDMYPFPN